MSRALSSIAAVGLLAVAAGPAAGQRPAPGAMTAQFPAIAPVWNPPAAAILPGTTGFPTPGVGFFGGYRNQYTSGGYILPAFGGSYFAPSFYGFGGAYPSYLYANPFGGFLGASATSLYDSSIAPATGLVGANFGPTPAETPAAIVPLQPAGNGTGRQLFTGTKTATLVVSLPAAGDVWFDGVKQGTTGTTHTLVSPALRAGDSHRYDVKAEWTLDGKKYRAEREVSVAAGDRQRLTLVLGDEVK